MIPTQFVTSSDGARIAYDASGSGPALLLLHGFGNDRRSVWFDLGWVERLSGAYRVITVDLRGCGKSDIFEDPARYSPALHQDDLHAVADACGAAEFAVFGFSWGATISLHLGASSPRVTRVICAGSYFGYIFTAKFVQAQLDQMAAGGQQAVYRARIVGTRSWPGVSPGDLRCPALVITGTQDGNVVRTLETQRESILAAGVQLRVFEGLDHSGLVTAIDTVGPVIESFLRG